MKIVDDGEWVYLYQSFLRQFVLSFARHVASRSPSEWLGSIQLEDRTIIGIQWIRRRGLE